MLKKWAVNLRLEQNGFPIPKEVERKILKIYATKCELGMGNAFYFVLPDNSVGFISCPDAKNSFAGSYGWFPATFPYDDPYQPIPKGMISSDFIKILEEMGFSKIEFQMT